MAPSPVPERVAAYEAAIAALQAHGAEVTAEAVWRRAGGRRGNVQAYIRTWKAAPREASLVAPCPVVLVAQAPAPPPTPHLARLAQERQALAHEVEHLQRRVQQVSVAEQSARFAARQALETLRTATRRAQQAPPHEMSAAFAQVEAGRAQLAASVGEAEAHQAAEDLSYVPAGLR